MDASLPASSMRPREMGHCKGDRGRLWRDPFRDLPCSKLHARPSSARPGPASRSDRRRWLHASVKVARHDAKRGDRSDCRAPDDLTRLLRSVGNHDERIPVSHVDGARGSTEGSGSSGRGRARAHAGGHRSARSEARQGPLPVPASSFWPSAPPHTAAVAVVGPIRICGAPLGASDRNNGGRSKVRRTLRRSSLS